MNRENTVYVTSGRTEQSLFDLFTIYIACSRDPAHGSEYPMRNKEQFEAWWESLLESGKQPYWGEKLNADYKDLLGQSVKRGMNVVRSFLDPKQSGHGREY